MKCSLKNSILLSLIFSSLLFAGCGKKSDKTSNKISDLPEIQVEKPNHSWYYFSQDGFFKIDKPQNAPFQPQLPWTEARRISSAGITTDSDEKNQAFAVVNRLGMLTFENDKITLAKDTNIFTNRTADNLVFLNNTPVFAVYKSAFFNETITDSKYKKDNSQHLFLLQFDTTSGIFYPLLNCNNLTAEPNSEVIDFTWDGLNWLCSVKTLEESKYNFSYISWKPTVSLLDLSPGTAKESLTIQEASQEDFRNSKAEINFSKAPGRIKNLTKTLAQKKSFNVELKNAGGASPVKYTNQVQLSAFTEKPLNSKAILASSWSGILFEDGTLFLEGSLPEKHILRDGNPVAVRLPKLPAGFVYSDFVISGTTLYAAWEETSFYNTGKSGFLQVNLEKTLYSKLR